jgi:hypothetical protein
MQIVCPWPLFAALLLMPLTARADPPWFSPGTPAPQADAAARPQATDVTPGAPQAVQPPDQALANTTPIPQPPAQMGFSLALPQTGPPAQGSPDTASGVATLSLTGSAPPPGPSLTVTAGVGYQVPNDPNPPVGISADILGGKTGAAVRLSNAIPFALPNDQGTAQRAVGLGVSYTPPTAPALSIGGSVRASSNGVNEPLDERAGMATIRVNF